MRAHSPSSEVLRADVARQKLLDAAVRVFGLKGPDGATVRDIAREAGQNVASIAYYFGGKEQMYHQVLLGMANEIHQRLADVLPRIARLKEAAEPSAANARELLQDFFEAVYLRVLSRSDALPLARLIVREQMQPTAGFEILYERAFRDLHRSLCWLVGTAIGQSAAATETIIRTHSLMGQVYFFVMARETILRRLGWKTLEGRNANAVAEVIRENVDVLLKGLHRKPSQKISS